MAAVCTITSESDADFSASFNYQNALGAAIDITGATFKLGLRANLTDATSPLVLSSANGMITITNASQGAFKLNVPQATLLTLPAGTYYHSLIMSVGSAQTLIWTGTWTHTPGPSR